MGTPLIVIFLIFVGCALLTSILIEIIDWIDRRRQRRKAKDEYRDWYS